MVSWLVRSSPDRAVWIRYLSRDIALCSWARYFTLTVLQFSPPRYISEYQRTVKGNPAMK